MQLSVSLPDDLARRVIEAFAAEEYRTGQLTHADLHRLLGFSTHAALDAFLKARGDFARERPDLERP